MGLSSSYDRRAASRILAEFALPGLFPPQPAATIEPDSRVRIAFDVSPMPFEPGSGLTTSQRLYLERAMRPCPPEMVTSATHRIIWTDTDGVLNSGHFGPSGLGPIVAIAAREATLVRSRELAANTELSAAIADLDADRRAALAATTTDRHPLAIFRTGLDTTARTVAQHALIAHHTVHGTAAHFARGMLAAGLFETVAGTWFWGLQSSTYRRGMVPVSLETDVNGAMRYTSDSVTMLRHMKEATIADTRSVMRRATQDEGLSVDQAVQRYHHELGRIPRQYALLDDADTPRCLAQMPQTVDGQRFTIVPGVARAWVDTFCRLLDTLDVVERSGDSVHDGRTDSTPIG